MFRKPHYCAMISGIFRPAHRPTRKGHRHSSSDWTYSRKRKRKSNEIRFCELEAWVGGVGRRPVGRRRPSGPSCSCVVDEACYWFRVHIHKPVPRENNKHGTGDVRKNYEVNASFYWQRVRRSFSISAFKNAATETLKSTAPLVMRGKLLNLGTNWPAENPHISAGLSKDNKRTYRHKLWFRTYFTLVFYATE